MKSSFPVKQKTLLIVGIAAAGIVLIVTAIIVILFFTGREPSIQGSWHNDDYQKVLQFDDDNMVVIYSPSGDYVATYVFDAKSGDGVILFNDKSIQFYIKGNSIFLIGENGEIEYVRGTMKINVSATTSPTPSVTDTSAATTTPTPAVTSEAGETTPAVTETSTPTPTATSTPTPTPTATSTPTLPIVTINPGIIFDPIDPIFPILGTPILGIWIQATDEDIHFEFFSDGKYTWINEGIYETTDNYTYNSFSGVGEFYSTESGWTPFTVDDDTLFVGTIRYNRS